MSEIDKHKEYFLLLNQNHTVVGQVTWEGNKIHYNIGNEFFSNQIEGFEHCWQIENFFDHQEMFITKEVENERIEMDKGNGFS